MLFNKRDQATHFVKERDILIKIVPSTLQTKDAAQREAIREALINGRSDGKLSQKRVYEILLRLRNTHVISEPLQRKMEERFAEFLDSKWGENEVPEEPAEGSAENVRESDRPVYPENKIEEL